MRQIKFRIWHHKDKYMITSDASVATIIQKYLKGWGSGMQSGNYEIDGAEYSIMQFTGLQDKKGTDLFEGDIIQSLHFVDHKGKKHYLNHAIEWSERLSGWGTVPVSQLDIEESKRQGNPQLWVYVKNYEFDIIGNIHRNPELL